MEHPLWIVFAVDCLGFCTRVVQALEPIRVQRWWRVESIESLPCCSQSIKVRTQRDRVGFRLYRIRRQRVEIFIGLIPGRSQDRVRMVVDGLRVSDLPGY